MALPEGWVPIAIPPEFRSGARKIAELCNWVIKPREDGRWNVCLRENFEKSRPRVYTVDRVVDAAHAADQEAYQKFARWRGQDRYLSDHIRRLGLVRLDQLGHIPERIAVWEAFSLANLIANDSELPAHLQEAFPVLAQQLPKSSLWMLTVDPMLHTREAAIRALFTSHEAPEYLPRAESESLGFPAGRGLGAAEGLGTGAFVQTGLVVGAPGVLGMATARLPGTVVLLFGHYESGRTQGIAAELLDLFRPRLLSDQTADVLSFPKLEPAVIEAYFRWWVERLNELLALVVDPAVFRRDDRSEDGTYDAAGHLGFQLSIDRLFATLRGILVASRRDEFTRTILSYQAFDLLSGLGMGNYRRLADPGEVSADVEALKKSMPPEVASVVIGRCERAADALATVEDGFYLKERVTSAGLGIRKKSGTWETIALDRAVAEYVNLVRDAQHALGKKMRDPRQLSLFAAHDGRLPAEIADVPFIHLLRLLANPQNLRRALRQGPV